MDTKKKQDEEAAKYPGVAIDIADGEKTDAAAEKERTEELGFNPRNDEDDL